MKKAATRTLKKSDPKERIMHLVAQIKAPLSASDKKALKEIKKRLLAVLCKAG